MDFEAVADELYALRPQDFTAARNARAAEAREAGDRTLAEKIGKLRRPSLSAWASNLLVREQPGEVEPLLRLGEGLRQAHHDLDGAQLRELSRRQHALINALSRQARRLAAQAGHPVGEDVQREIETTLHAVLADPEAAAEWAAGRLTKPLSATVGFPGAAEGAVPQRAPAAPPTPEPPSTTRRPTKADEQRRRRLAGARRQVESAERDVRGSEEEVAAAGRAEQDARTRLDRLQQRMGELAEELDRLKGEHRRARADERTAHERLQAADRRAREARRRAEAAAAQVERLTAQDR